MAHKGLHPHMLCRKHPLGRGASQAVVCASVLTGFVETAKAEGVGAALDAMDVADVALLGSGMGVTGLISAISATLTRPALVEALLSLAAAQQLVWVLNKGMRRGEAAQVAAVHA